MAPDTAVLDWMLDADPALRWQVERDLAGAPEEVWKATRARIATEGFGARLLAVQDADGQWAGGAYFPKDFDFRGPEAAEGAGEEYLLQRRLMLTASTGELVGPWVLQFAYPFRWLYSVLNAADYFRAATLYDGATPDPRLAEAIEDIRAARRADGTWLQERRHPGRVWFDVDVPPGEPSKWITFLATRVLAWWDGAPCRPSSTS